MAIHPSIVKYEKHRTRINLYLWKGAGADISLCKYGFVMNIKLSLPQFKSKLILGVDSRNEYFCVFGTAIRKLLKEIVVHRISKRMHTD